MIAYQDELISYLADRKSICETFFTDVANAQETCEIATHCAHTGREQNAAQSAFKAQIRTAAQTRSEAIDALGSPPAMPINN